MSSSLPEPSPDLSEIDRCIALLEQLCARREQLLGLDLERRRALLRAAGELSRPERAAHIAGVRARRKVERRERKQRDIAVLAGTELRTSLRSSVYTPPAAVASDGDGDLRGELERERACYVCKAPYRRVHFFYHSMCPGCARRNYAKRQQTADLTGQTALVTGGRLKIGYQTALNLLRAGARVVVTTRFPHDAAERYGREPDHDSWLDRLEVHGLDLRHIPSVELFADYLGRHLSGLDILINNAAQTVRRPPAFYAHLLAGEQRPVAALPAPARAILDAHARLRDDALVAGGGDRAAIGLLEPARLSQLVLTDGDVDALAFPRDHFDPDLQQVDRRRVNSWRFTASDVPTPELLEVHLVNAIAPFVLCSRLKPVMCSAASAVRHIVNVSAMEAQFARRTKTDKHPHTNMAKAALNMLTRTSAVDYLQSGILMNSVDTGWITDEDPLHHVDRKQDVHDFHPPLDVIDGAARVLDPIFTERLTGEKLWGLFLKDYSPTPW